MKVYTKNDLFKIEKAILFLVKFVSQYKDNPKPLILHSVRVGTKLMDLNAPVNIVIAGILHDIVEDTHCTFNIIQKKYGKKVVDIIIALTQDYSFKNYKDRWLYAEKCINKIGKYGWLIKMVDAKDNLPYYSKILKSKKRFIEMMWKHKLVIKNSKKYWSNLNEYKDYEKLSKYVIKKWKIKF